MQTAPIIKVAIGIIAWNEEKALRATLASLFQQTLFRKFSLRHWRCEIVCVANGCTDRTAEVATEIFLAQSRNHRYKNAFSARVVDLTQRGKVNAWNQFVHSISARDAQYLFMMDADILIHRPESLWAMFSALENDQEASVAVDRPCKDILFKQRKSIWERLSLATARLTTSADAQLCGQLYCIRAGVVRNIYLPKDLAACEDGFIKTLVCTDFLTRPPVAGRIRLAEGAEHTFESYISPRAIIRNQKRQIIGQTIVHIVIDKYLKARPLCERERAGETLAGNDNADPAWLKKLIQEHLQRTRSRWRLYPGMTGLGFQRLRKLNVAQRVICFPAAAAKWFVAVISGFFAYEALKAGCTDYWPQAKRQGLVESK
ncbi:MAG TPA: glycosyltransferase [Verrucomicrobiae bacterium]|jgi:glycosyltransferase involved in cell wall biosynthesis|nr:glycosyltransferase [Verrucomicrobiae bacterium]